MPAIFEFPHIVTADEIDVLGHANNLCYLSWMQAAALAHSAAQGWPAEAYQRLGLGWVVRSHEITYERPALEGDSIVVRTWVAGFKRASSVRRYDMLRTSDGKTLWHAGQGQNMQSSPITYELDGRQYVLTSGGGVMFAWVLPEK